MEFLRRSLSSGSFGSKNSDTKKKIKSVLTKNALTKNIFTKNIFGGRKRDDLAEKTEVVLAFIGHNSSNKTKFISDHIASGNACSPNGIVLDVYIKTFSEYRAHIFDTSIDHSEYCISEINKMRDIAIVPIIFYDNSAYNSDDFAVMLWKYDEIISRADCLFTISDDKNSTNESEILQHLSKYKKETIKHYYLATAYSQPIISDILANIC